jgi:lipopolysaccharide export system permease protein
MDRRLGLFKKGQIWHRGPQRIWSAQLSVPLEQRLLGVTIYTLDEQGVIRQRYDAAEARYNGQGWLLVQGIRRTFTSEGLFAGAPETFTEYRVSFPERPEEISALRKEPDEMSLRETLAYAYDLQRQGVADPTYLVAFHGKLAYAALCILMAGFGMPLALHMNRNGGLTLALSLTLLCGFAYVILHNFLLALGYNGRLPPAVAAWATNGVFGSGGLYLAARLQ